jgi:CubicO group peptidase (beta-lactamase class C family)
MATSGHASPARQPQRRPDGVRIPWISTGEPLPTTLQILDGVRPATNVGVRVDLIPGRQSRYSGGGTTVLQQLLKDVTGTPFRDLMQELVLGPLGMASSDYAQPPPPISGRGQPLDTTTRATRSTASGRVYPQFAAAGLWTTPTDLAKVAGAVRRAIAGRPGAVISAELAREMLTPQIASTSRIGGLDHVGLGFFVDETGTRFGHSGGNRGFCCHLLADRETGQGAVVMTNGDAGGFVVLRAFANIAADYGWSDYPLAVDHPDLPTDDLLNSLAGRYRPDNGVPVEVTPAVRGLDVRFAGQPALHFRGLSTERFAAMELGAELGVRGGDLVLRLGGVEHRCVRE